MTACEGSCVEGDRRCSPEGIQNCERGDDGCGTWSMPQPCPAGTVCEGEVCQPTECQDACPKEISIAFISRMNRDYAKSALVEPDKRRGTLSNQ